MQTVGKCISVYLPLRKTSFDVILKAGREKKKKSGARIICFADLTTASENELHKNLYNFRRGQILRTKIYERGNKCEVRRNFEDRSYKE